MTISWIWDAFHAVTRRSPSWRCVAPSIHHPSDRVAPPSLLPPPFPSSLKIPTQFKSPLTITSSFLLFHLQPCICKYQNMEQKSMFGTTFVYYVAALGRKAPTSFVIKSSVFSTRTTIAYFDNFFSSSMATLKCKLLKL